MQRDCGLTTIQEGVNAVLEENCKLLYKMVLSAEATSRAILDPPVADRNVVGGRHPQATSAGPVQVSIQASPVRSCGSISLGWARGRQRRVHHGNSKVDDEHMDALVQKYKHFQLSSTKGPSAASQGPAAISPISTELSCADPDGGATPGSLSVVDSPSSGMPFDVWYQAMGCLTLAGTGTDVGSEAASPTVANAFGGRNSSSTDTPLACDQLFACDFHGIPGDVSVTSQVPRRLAYDEWQAQMEEVPLSKALLASPQLRALVASPATQSPGPLMLAGWTTPCSSCGSRPTVIPRRGLPATPPRQQRLALQATPCASAVQLRSRMPLMAAVDGAGPGSPLPCRKISSLLTASPC